MGTDPTILITGIFGLVTVSVLGTLYVLASIMRDATRRIELFREVAKLRAEYVQRVRDLQARGFDVPMPQHLIHMELDIRQPAPRKAA
jgi:hypothetical protein